jgi:hypothetical protein
MSTPTGILFSDPRVKPLSASGLFQAACYLQFYLTGTTTLANVYADAGLTTPMNQTPGAGGNSTTAAADGRFLPIYMDPGVTYRVQLYSATGVLLEDTDPYIVPAGAVTTGQGQTQAEKNAGVTPTSTLYTPGDVRRYGADPTGAADSTSAFQRALNSNNKVTVPDGTYTITAGSLSMPIGTEIELSLGAVISFTATSAQFAANTSYVFLPLGTNKIRGGKFVCASDYGTVVWINGAISDVTVERVQVSGATLLTGGSSAAYINQGGYQDQYQNVTSANSPSGIRVLNCRAVAATVNTTAGAIGCNYVTDALYQGNHVEAYYHGIVWWGGNSGYQQSPSAPYYDGLPFTNTRKTSQVRVVGNYVYNVQQGGIWGSMGQDTVVSGNTVIDAGDTGIDFEGDFNSVATGNTVRVTGAKACNVCISTFYTVKGVLFTGNVVETAKSTVPLYGHYNASNLNTNSYDVALIGNRFSCVDAGGGAGVVQVNSAIHDIKISDNDLFNCVINANGLGLHNTKITDNSLVFTTVTAQVNAIYVTAYNDSSTSHIGHAVVTGNDIWAAAAMAAGSVGIQATHLDTNGAASYHIRDNRVNGNFPTAVAITNSTTLIPLFNVGPHVPADGSLRVGVTASKSLAVSDIGTVQQFTGPAGQTITLPTTAAAPVAPEGAQPMFTILNSSANSLSVAVGGTDTLTYYPAGSSGTRTLAASGIMRIYKAVQSSSSDSAWICEGVGIT